MKTIVINECTNIEPAYDVIYDLSKIDFHHCIGCWTCWWKTPGKCIYKELDAFYHDYISADKVIYAVKVSRGFVSGKLKSLFDRMIPLYLPYIDYNSGESMHVPRYEKYPDVDFYYEGTFGCDEERIIYEDYIRRTFYQFYSRLTYLGHVNELISDKGGKK